MVGAEVSARAPGGVRDPLTADPETLPELRVRARTFLDAVQALPARSVLIASHGTFLQQLHGLLLQRSVHAALARHVRSLQIDEFTLRPGGLPEHRQVHPGLDAEPLW